jgi:hypothetical protein
LLRLAVNALLFAATLAVPAQRVILVSPSSMQFSDDYGVTFRYPAKWSFTEKNNFYSPFSIASKDSPAGGIVFFSSNGGYNPYPRTNLTGVEFVYANRQAASAEECLKHVLQDAGEVKTPEAKKMNGMNCVYAQIFNGGMCHQITEDIYATSGGAICYLFDLAVETRCAGVVDGERALTSDELAQIHSSLETILSSVEISDVRKD